MDATNKNNTPADIQATASALRCSLDYSRSRICESSLSRASNTSSIMSLSKDWPSTISVLQDLDEQEELKQTSIPQLSKEVQSRIVELGINLSNEGISTGAPTSSKIGLMNSRTHSYRHTASVYRGQVETKDKQDIPHGQGNLYLPNGSFFSGHFIHGFANGKGKLILPDGSYYEGTFYNNLISGKGKFVEGTTVYEGEFKDGVLHGKGTLTCPGAVFTGIYNQGTKVQGVLVWGQHKEYVYMGGFQHDMFHGKGSVKSPQGHFDGYFVEGKKEGIGIYTLCDGTRYEGSFSNDMKNGYGQCFDRKGKLLFKGYWKDDVPMQEMKADELTNSYMKPHKH